MSISPTAPFEAADTPLERPAPLSTFQALARRSVHAALARIRDGELALVDAAGTRVFGRRAADAPCARVEIVDPDAYRALLLGGSVGGAEAYVAGHWRCDDLVALVRIFVRNRVELEGLEGGPARVAEWLRRVWHRARPNSRRGSRRNIEAHYDLGNDFFETFLDPSLTYSAAIFESPTDSLERAQHNKYARLCRSLRLEPGMRVLEIGGGWGGFAVHAAREHGVHVTTTTISPSQHALARERIARAGLESRIELLCEDYRDLTGRFDRVVSIEMIEAVGPEFMDTFLRTCAERLDDDGALGLQAITIGERDFARARDSVDFIKRWVFPGGGLPSLESILAALRRTSNLRLDHVDEIGLHYAETLRRWRAAFAARLDDVRALGHDERFLRLWEFYLAYCEGGFEERHIGCAQLVLARPRCRTPFELPKGP